MLHYLFKGENANEEKMKENAIQNSEKINIERRNNG